jgi:predicted CoA-binding protein
MISEYEKFWRNKKFAVVGHSKKRNFPKLTYQGLKNLEKTVYPIDSSVSRIENDSTFTDFSSLPEKVDAVVLELPKEETKDWIEKAVDAGVKNIWCHMQTETPEAIAFAQEKEVNLLTGTCAVMYLQKGFTYHSIHKWIMKLVGKY